MRHLMSPLLTASVKKLCRARLQGNYSQARPFQGTKSSRSIFCRCSICISISIGLNTASKSCSAWSAGLNPSCFFILLDVLEGSINLAHACTLSKVPWNSSAKQSHGVQIQGTFLCWQVFASKHAKLGRQHNALVLQVLELLMSPPLTNNSQHVKSCANWLLDPEASALQRLFCVQTIEWWIEPPLKDDKSLTLNLLRRARRCALCCMFITPHNCNRAFEWLINWRKLLKIDTLAKVSITLGKDWQGKDLHCKSKPYNSLLASRLPLLWWCRSRCRSMSASGGETPSAGQSCDNSTFTSY